MLLGGTVLWCAESDSIEAKYDIEMVYIEGGTFMMGCAPEQERYCHDEEKPVHKVAITRDFYVGKYEVTQKQWREIMGTDLRQQRDKAGNGLSIRGEGDSYPMYYVSWYETVEFCNRLSELAGLKPAYGINKTVKDGENGVSGTNGIVTLIPEANGYRLPTEAEWEYAARGGNKSNGYQYSGGNDAGEIAWYDSNSEAGTHPVGTRKANELGIHDMTGNVDEWVFDRYGFSYYANSPALDPAGPAEGTGRVVRGGSWYIHARNARVSIRYSYNPDLRSFNLGFRLARNSK